MKFETWPYGTIKQVEVLSVDPAVTVVRELDTDEGFVLLGEKAKCSPGDRGTITFKEGGSTGGYWKLSFLRDNIATVMGGDRAT